MQAAVANNVEGIKLLQEESGMQDEGSWTALMWAVSKGNENAVEVLASYSKQ